MIEIDTGILLRDCRSALSTATQQRDINGFAIVFEVGQPAPCFYFAINTTSNGIADPSTGEWDYPAGGFDGADPTPECQEIYSRVHTYLDEWDEDDSRVDEIREVFVTAMTAFRKELSPSLPGCVFTVNECNDYDEVIETTFKRINK